MTPLGAEPDLAAGFRAAMRQLAATVTIVTTRTAGGPAGMTATAVTSLCTDPPALLVCVNRAASIHGAFAVGTPFCVNLLGEPHTALATAFGGAVDPAARFERGPWRGNAEGVPFLPDAAALVFCSVDLLLSYGTHTIVVGKVTAAEVAPARRPLLYGDGRYVALAAPAA